MTQSQMMRFQPEMSVFPKSQFKDYPDVLNVQQTAELLSVCKNSIYKLLREQSLPYRRIGSAIRIRKKDVLLFMEGKN